MEESQKRRKENGMKRKLWALCILYIAALILSVAVFPNIDVLKNMTAGNGTAEYDSNDCTFVNWTVSEGGLTSAQDSQIQIIYYQGFINNIALEIEGVLPEPQIRVYYLSGLEEMYSEERSMEVTPRKTIGGYNIPIGKEAKAVRLDLTEESGYELKMIKITVNPGEIQVMWVNALPFLLGGITAFCVRRRGYIIKDICTERTLIIEMAKNDLKSRYAGSVLGIIWAYVQPLLTIFVFWFVFQVGFKNPPVSDIEYILWFVAGYIPWLLFNDGIVNTTNALQEYSYLVKKIKFKVSILPVIKLASGFFIHLFFVLFIMLVYMLYGHWPRLIWLQAFYYSFALMFLLFGLGLIFSSLAVLFKDCAQVISVILQVLFWYTPIVWSINGINSNILMVFKANPLFYVINGYRETFISGTGYWEHPALNIYYWSVALVVLLIGCVLFDRFKPHFSDLL